MRTLLNEAIGNSELIDDVARKLNAARAKKKPVEISSISGISSPATEPISPEPLQLELPSASTYPYQALGSILGSAAQALQQTIKCPDSLCGQSVLAAAALATQAHADVLLDGRRVPLSLYAITIAASGERKSAVDKQALAEHRDYERALVKKYQRDFYKYENDVSKRNAKAFEEIDALSEPLQAPLLPNLLVSDPTLEGIYKLLAHGQPSIGIFSDEGGQFLGGWAMNKQNLLRTTSGLSHLWDGGQIDRVRAGDGASILYGRRVSLHLLVQPVVAERIYANELFIGQGLLSRFLTVWPTTTMGTRSYTETDLSQSAAMLQYWRCMHELLVARPAMTEHTRNELAPRTLSLTDEAKRLWITAHDAMEKRMGPSGDLEPIRALASKAAEQSLRIAGVLTIVSNLHAPLIEADTMSQAIELVAFYLTEALRLVGGTILTPETRRAAAVLRWCHNHGHTRVHSGQITQYGPDSVREARLVLEAMRVLEVNGWATPIEGGAVIDGCHRRRVWSIHPQGAL